MMLFEPAVETDLSELEQLLASAKRSMAKQGIYQWTQEYPNSSDILTDIRQEELFLIKEVGRIVCMGTFTRKPMSGKGFNKEELNWFIKRLVTRSDETGKGIGKCWLDFCISHFCQVGEHVYSCTNHTNFPMQRLFQKNQFEKIAEMTVEKRERMGSFYVYEREIGKIDE